MSFDGTEYGDIDQRTAAYAAVDMLEHAEPIFVLKKFGATKELPKNKADKMKFRRPIPFTVATTPLVEGITPAAQTMQYEDVPVTMLQYGAYTKITDKIANLAEDPVLKDATELSGEQAGETAEMLLWGTVKGGTSLAYANGAARTDVNTPISINLIQGATRFLNAQRAKKITSMLSSSPNYATKAVEAGYIAFCHTDCDSDIRAIPGFVSVADYGSRQPLCTEELGSVETVRFITSPLLTPFADAGGDKGTMKSTTGTDADVYPVIVVGKNAYAHVPLKGKSAIVPKVVNPDSIDKTDPLGQWGFVSWKMWDASVILNQLWMVRLEVAVTDLMTVTTA
jgi:N4-gp56 family major capsid protein